MLLLDGLSRAGRGLWFAVLAVMLAAATCCAGVSLASTGVIRTIDVGLRPDGVFSDGTHVWVTSAVENNVSEIEASTGTVIRTIDVGNWPYDVSADGTHVWVTQLPKTGTHAQTESVFEIDASSGTLIRTIRVGLNPAGVFSDGSYVWVTNLGGNSVSEIEASSGNVIRTFHAGGWPRGVSLDGTHLWVADWKGHKVSEIEESSGTIMRTIHVGSRPWGLSSDGTQVWVANSAENTVSEIEASTGRVINTIGVGNTPSELFADGTHVWVANYEEGTVSEIGASNAPNATCTGNSGTITLSPGLTNAASAQTMKIKGTLTGCAGEAFKEANYTARLMTSGAVSCSVLKATGETASGPAKYKWVPKAKTSKGTLSFPLSETAGSAFSGALTSGSYSPLTLSGSVTESYAGAGTCGEAGNTVKDGTFSGSSVSFE